MRYRVKSFEEAVHEARYIVLAEPQEVGWQEDAYHGQARVRILEVLLARGPGSPRAADPAIAPGREVRLDFATARPNVESLPSPWLVLISSPLGTAGRFKCDRDHPFKPSVLAARIPALVAARPR